MRRTKFIVKRDSHARVSMMNPVFCKARSILRLNLKRKSLSKQDLKKLIYLFSFLFFCLLLRIEDKQRCACLPDLLAFSTVRQVCAFIWVVLLFFNETYFKRNNIFSAFKCLFKSDLSV